MWKDIKEGVIDVAESDVGEVAYAVLLLPIMLVGGWALKLYRTVTS